MLNLDPALAETLDRGAAQDEVAVIIRLEDPDAMPPGARIVARFGPIATCRLRRDAILPVHAASGVASVKAPVLYTPDVEVTSDGAGLSMEMVPEQDDRRPRSAAETGRGVVVGFVDWGLDFAHPNFRNADGSTRVLALWDQRPGPDLARPNRYGYGVVHVREDIDRALRAADPYRALGYHPADADTGPGAHGTHTADIALGNGRAEGAPIGVAPEADLVFVHFSTWGEDRLERLGDSVALLEAVDFIAHIAGERPWVLNLSMGRQAGSHDGLSLVEQGLDAALLERPGRACIQSTGNYYSRDVHSYGLLRPGEERLLRMEVESGKVLPHEVDIWYAGRDRITIEVLAPGGMAVGRAAQGEQAVLRIDGREAGKLYNRRRDPNNLENEADVFLYPSAPAGTWQVKLIAEDVVDGRFHCWIERDVACPHCQPRFDPADVVRTTTTGSICNGYRSVAVGAYDAHSPDKDLGIFSSSGPTADGRQKPDLVAPGVSVLAARSTPRRAEPEAPLLTRMSGTSMAAPHVTGTVALMFEAAGRPLAIQETRNALLSSIERGDLPQESNARIGSGYLDIDAAVEAARVIGKEPARPAARHEADEFLARAGSADSIAREQDAASERTEAAAISGAEALPMTAGNPASSLDTVPPVVMMEGVSEEMTMVGAPAMVVEDIPIEEIALVAMRAAEALERDNPDAPAESVEETSMSAEDVQEYLGEARHPSSEGVAFGAERWATGPAAREGTGAVVNPVAAAPVEAGARLVELADEAVHGYGGRRAAATFLEDLLIAAGVSRLLSPPPTVIVPGSPATVVVPAGGDTVPPPAEVFNSFTYMGREPERQRLEQVFTVVAAPGTRLTDTQLRSGDVLVRSAWGEGPGHIAILHTGDCRRHDQLAAMGLRPEGPRHGLYAWVIEGGPWPHAAHHGFARLVADPAGWVPRNQLVLRIRPEALGETAWRNGGAGFQARQLAEGGTETADLSDGFFAAVHAVAAAIGTQPEYLLGVMNAESGIRASAHNPNGDASGLIQFMPATLRGLGWTQGHEAFRQLSAEEQMPFVERYYRPYVPQGLNSTARLYQVTFLPATLSRGSDPDTVLVDVNNNDNAFAYAPNRGLDRRGDGRILVGDLTAYVERAKGSARWREAAQRLQAVAPGPMPPVPIPPAPLPPTAHPVLRRGARGEAVREAQAKLNVVHGRSLAAGQPGLQSAPLQVDGVFGPRTYNAVVSFQQHVFPANPHEWDGVIGPRTWTQLDAASDGTILPSAPAPPPAPTPVQPLDNCFAQLPAPAAFATPARDLTRQEARDIVVYLLGRGAFRLRHPANAVRFDANCALVQQPDPGTRFVIERGRIDDVDFRYVGHPAPGHDLDNLDVRMVVLLYRLAHMLRTTWGVTEIQHLGIGHGNPAHPNDCHNTGRAIDFAGVKGVAGGNPFEIAVLRDWGKKPVVMPDGRQLREWPPDFRDTFYRLDPARDGLAYAIFRDVYDFAARECTDTSPRRLGNSGSPTTIGRSSRFIIHPDHPNPALRAQHQDHIHMQIGPTGAEQHPGEAELADEMGPVEDIGDGPPFLTRAVEGCWEQARMLRRTLSRASNPATASAARIRNETGVHVDGNPYSTVTTAKLEAVIRAAFNSTQMPEVLLALWAKEGSLRMVTSPRRIDQATTAQHAKTLFRCAVYYEDLGADHFVVTTRAGSGTDNTWDSRDQAADGHEQHFVREVRRLVSAQVLPEDIGGAINAELIVSATRPFTVQPTVKFYALSLLLVDALFTQMQHQSFTQIDSVSPSLNYLQWNMGSDRFRTFLESADQHRREPQHQVGGQPISIEQWALHTRPRANEWQQARTNAIRFMHYCASFQPIFVDAMPLIKPGSEDLVPPPNMG